MNISQVNWAKSHDWFLYAFEDDSTGEWSVCAETLCIALDGERFIERRIFTNLSELRAWAGY